MTTATVKTTSSDISHGNLMTVNREWRKRPMDERYTSLLDLHAAKDALRATSKHLVIKSNDLTAVAVENDPLGLQIIGKAGNAASFTNYSFSQFAKQVTFPTQYIQSLPSNLAADCINHAIKMNGSDEIGALFTRNTIGDNETSLAMRAITSAKYGRVWDAEITRQLVDRFGDGVTGQWKVPGEFGEHVKVTKANTTIFGSDRDMFVFLCDEENKIELPNRRNGEVGLLSRGFIVKNSEVGAGTLMVAMFYFDYACSNRIIWGLEGYREVSIRHSKTAPERWLTDILPMLNEYRNTEASKAIAPLMLAQQTNIEDASEGGVLKLLTNSKIGFVPSVAKQIMSTHMLEEGRPIETLWDAVTGVTAYAKTIDYQDERVMVEKTAGKIIDMVAA